MIRFFLIFLVGLLGLSACSSQEKADFARAKRAVGKSHFQEALKSFDRVIKRDSGSDLVLESAREAARVSFYDLKDYKRAIEYYRYLVLHSPEPQERMQSQKTVATIYFDNLQNYAAAIDEFSKLIEMPHNDLEGYQYRLSMARAYYYMGNYFQALSEADAILAKKTDENIRFAAMTLKGDILVAQKDFNKAVTIFQTVMQEDPEKAMKEGVGLTLAGCYEENGDYKSAIKVLEGYRNKYNPPEYIELRIKRLQERQRNAPGAKGFRK